MSWRWKKNDLERTKKKFDVAYLVAKKRLSMKMYPDLLELEQKHGVDLGQSYNNEIQCGNFIDYIAKDMKNKVNEDLKNATFFSILSDGSKLN